MAQRVRVFKLASDFGLENSEMVAKIQEFGFPVQNYMSALDSDTAQQVRTLLQKEREANTVEEQIRPTVVRRRTRTGAPVKPARISPPKADAADETQAAPVKKIRAVDSSVSTRVDDKVVAAQSLEAAHTATGKIEQPEEAMTHQSVAETPLPIDDRIADNDLVAESVVSDSIDDADSYDEDLAAEFTADEIESGDAAVGEIAEVVAPDVLRPASEAPIVRRRIQTPDAGKDSKKGAARRRKVESREMTPSRRAQVPVSRTRAVAAPASPLGRKRKMTPGKKGKKTEITTPKAIKRVIKVEGQVTLQELAKRMSVKSTELLMKLMSMGMAGININSTLDIDTSKIIAEEFGYEVEDVAVAEEDLLAASRAEETEEEKASRSTRAPVVTMMGHVDHGKTSLLDYIRKANVAEGEAGGITQHVGAYRVKTDIGEIAFIDTPGHAAFTAMRARGANATDIVIVVCAADDGVMPQTIEAIEHARAAGCPIIVAINKCDLPNADVQKARRMLMEYNLIPEELGGDTIIVEVSAKSGQGIDQLLEMISLQAEIMELTANPKRAAGGVVLEAYLDKGRGPVAHVLVQDGTLDANDIIVAGQAFGKIRAMTNERGQKISKAGPSTPIEILGLSTVPAAGDAFDVVADMKIAEKVGAQREEKERLSAVGAARPSLDALYLKMQEGEQAELKLLVKADVRGTLEAIRESLVKLSNDKVKVTVVSASVGGITESDVLLASTADAIIIGFNVRPAGKARKLADEQGIEIKIYSVIYDILDSVEASMKGLLAPTIEQKVIGEADVREVFRIPKVGAIAGSYVTNGKVVRNGFARLIRESVQIWEGEVDSLRRFKDDAKEVQSGYECGIGLKGFNDIKEGDVIEFYLEEEVETQM
ncbi:MAG: translation initiation factor IF-2 [Deltaproteobacteria bacterium]|nr:translation initiation factor IF-2 [Deltaproteobacteria bacterium]MBN2671395.1 translation initiation factor IF-2 [Deltaproteobacteria bacterium]